MSKLVSELKLCIVSGMMFYKDAYGNYRMTHLYSVLEEIAKHFKSVIYVGMLGKADRESVERMTPIKDPKIHIVALKGNPRGWLRIILYLPLRFCQMAKHIRRSDVVFAKLSGYPGIVGFLLGRLFRKKVVTYLITDPAYTPASQGKLKRRVKSWLREKIWASVFERGDLRCYIAESWAKKYLIPRRQNDLHYIECSIWPKEKETVVKSPIHLDKTLKLLFMGRLAEGKGVDVLLRACQLLAKRQLDFRLFIVGDGPERERLTELRHELQLDEKVLFFGFIPHGERLWDIYESADIFVFPSRSEALPLVLLEAMAAGLPIVAARVGGIPDLIEDGANGVLVPPEDFHAMARTVEHLAKSTVLRERMARTNLKKIEAFFTPVQTEKLCSAIYRLFPEMSEIK